MLNYLSINNGGHRSIIPENLPNGLKHQKTGATTISFEPGFAAIDGFMVSIPGMVKDCTLPWISTGSGANIGVWGDGTQYLYCGYNQYTNVAEFFVSHKPDEKFYLHYVLKLIGAVFVIDGVIRDFFHDGSGYWFKNVDDQYSVIVPTASEGEYTMAIPNHPGTLGYALKPGVADGQFKLIVTSSAIEKDAEWEDATASVNDVIHGFIHVTENTIKIKRFGDDYLDDNYTVFWSEYYLPKL